MKKEYKVLRRLITDLYPESHVGNIDELNTIRQKLNISSIKLFKMICQFEKHKWIVKLNTPETPSIADYGKYATELFTGNQVFQKTDNERLKIMFKLKFALRMEA
jgi:hypothetical protein|tara:strand:+ start:4891 stop:5205 length:315 start_codon:yes stop_codon:yes gene_type:complete